jgi:hypothetical protein
MWDYRLLRDSDNNYGIYEVYYNKNGKPCGCSATPVGVSRTSVGEVKAELIMMMKAFNKPVLRKEDL